MSEKLYTTIGDEMREFTAAEYAQHSKDLIEYQASLIVEQNKKEARQAVLTKLGLTQDEANALLS